MIPGSASAGRALQPKFEVLGSELRAGDNNLLAECPPYELMQTVQAEVDKIVAGAKAGTRRSSS